MRPTVFGQYVVSAFRRTVLVAAAAIVIDAVPAAAQERFRISVNAGQQTTATTVTQEQTFDRYFEQGSFTFERAVPKAPIYDLGLAVRLWRGLHAGAAVSIFEKSGAATLTARVPHPLQFTKPRTTTGEIANASRREVGQHIMFGWMIPAPGRFDVLLFGGPSIFTAEQLFATSLNLSLDKEVFPFDELAFPGAQTETLKENVTGYNAGVDVSWRFIDKLGVGLLVRYSSGKRAFTPTGTPDVDVKVGGLHAGGGVRLAF